MVGLCEEEKSGCIIKVPLCVVCVGNRGHRSIYVGKCGLTLKPVLILVWMHEQVVCETTGSYQSSQVESS